MSKKEDAGKDSGSSPAVVSLDRVRDKLQRKRQDEQAAALAAQFHNAMGWKGTPDSSGGKKKPRKKKRK